MVRNLLLALLALTGLATPAAADTRVDNVDGYTIGENGRLVRFDGLLIGDDGRVRRLLRRGEARPPAGVRQDGGGRALMPGLIDAHGHVGSF